MDTRKIIEAFMSRNIITYIAYFDTQDSEVKRNYVTSASNKVEYIAKRIASLGHKVEIHSISEVKEDRFKYYPQEQKRISDGVTLYLSSSFGGNRGMQRKVKTLWHLMKMFFYLLFHCNKKDTVIVYHSLGYLYTILWAKRIKNFRLVLEVEEIYSDVSTMSAFWRTLEFRMFKIADAFILSNDLLDAKINTQHKPSIVIYGTYQVEPKRGEKFDDGKIHVVYAGTFDHNKGGAQASIAATEYLPENYHVHICGFGTDSDIADVQRRISEMQNKSKASITYDGLKKGEEFIRFLQQCHIGLSTQNPSGEFNDTSFPSKVLTYMANGLSVVSIRIPALKVSSIASALSFYDFSDATELANAIKNSDFHQSSRDLVDSLDQSFKQKLKSILRNNGQ